MCLITIHFKTCSFHRGAYTGTWNPRREYLNYTMFFKSSSEAKNLLDTMVSSLSFSVGCEILKSLGPKEDMMEMVE